MIGPAQKLPQRLVMPAVRLELEKSPEAHNNLATETRAFLAEDNIDSVVVSAPGGTSSLIIKPEPLDASKPTNNLTDLAKRLKEDGCIVHFHTGHYLSDIGTYNPVPKKELGGDSSLSVPWVELKEDGPLETLTLHEVRHFEQQEARDAFYNGQGAGPAYRPEVRIKFQEGQAPDNWVGRTPGYNGIAGHSTDEVDAYLYQSKLHLDRAQKKAKVDIASARTDARKAIICAAKAKLFADADSKALNMPPVTAQELTGAHREFLGDIAVGNENAVIFADTRDFQGQDFLAGLKGLANDLNRDAAEAKVVAGTALQILSQDEGALEAINEAMGQLREAGWLPKKSQ